MEVSSLKTLGAAGLRGPTPLLRVAGDERLVALTRRGNQAAYEALVSRYQSRLLAFCRHMLGSREDAEDVLQEVFAAAFNAMLADDRPINVRPWLYRIARNRSLNHMRRQQAIGVDSMDVHLAEHGATTLDKVHAREQFRELVGDVHELAETQRTALLLREIDALSYEQIAEAMDTTVPAVKSLLVRARVSLAEAAEARRMSCDDVRDELGEVAEGLRRRSPTVRRHLRQCDRCHAFDRDLRATNRALAAMFPLGPLLLLKKFLITHGAGQAAAGSATAGAGAAAASAGASGAVGAGLGAVVTKTAAGLAAAAIVTAGAVEVDHVQGRPAATRPAVRAAHPGGTRRAPAPRVLVTTPQPREAPGRADVIASAPVPKKPPAAPHPAAAAVPATPVAVPAAAPVPATATVAPGPVPAAGGAGPPGPLATAPDAAVPRPPPRTPPDTGGALGPEETVPAPGEPVPATAPAPAAPPAP